MDSKSFMQFDSIKIVCGQLHFQSLDTPGFTATITLNPAAAAYVPTTDHHLLAPTVGHWATLVACVWPAARRPLGPAP